MSDDQEFNDWFKKFNSWDVTYDQLISFAFTPGDDPGDIVYQPPDGKPAMTRYVCSRWIGFYGAAEAGWCAHKKLEAQKKEPLKVPTSVEPMSYSVKVLVNAAKAFVEEENRKFALTHPHHFEPPDECHPSHEVRDSDASSFDVICTRCGATDVTGVGWGGLKYPCTGSRTTARGSAIRNEPQQF